MVGTTVVVVVGAAVVVVVVVDGGAVVVVAGSWADVKQPIPPSFELVLTVSRSVVGFNSAVNVAGSKSSPSRTNRPPPSLREK